jgi:NADH-quinone oxidoreductase subunit J
MSELLLFAIVGGLAVAAAVMMLLSDNAVHSALFLVITMGCIAVLFLMLDAPFLAMIQITVYAGAIMVLFLFVIMLLGAERIGSAPPGERGRGYRWFTPVALTLGLSLLFAFGLVIAASQLDSTELPPAPPAVSVVHAATDVGPVDVYVNGELFAQNLAYAESTRLQTVPAGDYAIALVPVGAPAPEQPLATVALQPNTTQALVAHGVGTAVTLSAVPYDVSTVEARTTRLSVFNAFDQVEAISIVDFGSPFVEDDTTVIVADLARGEVSEPILEPAGTVNWSVIEAGNEINVLYPLSEVEFRRDRSTLLVVAAERQFDGTARALAIPVESEARPAFGSPRAIGYLLFTDYMLIFQLVALLLLASMIGVIALKQPLAKVRPRRVGRRKVSRPLVNVIAAQVGQENPARAADDDAERAEREAVGQ